jgi:hypothetical protein
LRGDCAASARRWHCSIAAVFAASSLGWPVTEALNPPTLSANALKSDAGIYSLANAFRARSLMNGILPVTSFSPEALGCGGAGAAAAAVGAGLGAAAAVGEGDGEGTDAGGLLEATCGLVGAPISSLVR